MKKLIKSSLLIAVLSFAFMSCGDENKSEEHNHKSHDHSEMSSTRYACPMKCEDEKTYDKKGECPVCHMDLKEVK